MIDWQALAVTFKLATVTTAILLVIAVPLSALLVLGTDAGRLLKCRPRMRWLQVFESPEGLQAMAEGLEVVNRNKRT